MNIPTNTAPNPVEELTQRILPSLMETGSAYIGCEVFNCKYNEYIVMQVARDFKKAGYYCKVNFRVSNNNVFSFEVSKHPLQAASASARAIYSRIL